MKYRICGSILVILRGVHQTAITRKLLYVRGGNFQSVLLCKGAITMLSYKVWSYEGQSLRDIKFELLEKFKNILTCMEDPPTGDG